MVVTVDRGVDVIVDKRNGGEDDRRELESVIEVTGGDTEVDILKLDGETVELDPED